MYLNIICKKQISDIVPKSYILFNESASLTVKHLLQFAERNFVSDDCHTAVSILQTTAIIGCPAKSGRKVTFFASLRNTIRISFFQPGLIYFHLNVLIFAFNYTSSVLDSCLRKKNLFPFRFKRFEISQDKITSIMANLFNKKLN